jgi:hypothetical protein
MEAEKNIAVDSRCGKETHVPMQHCHWPSGQTLRVAKEYPRPLFHFDGLGIQEELD